MDNRQPKRVIRNKKENIYLGTWTVLTMLQPGKMQEVAEQILQRELQIIALQEIRWKGQGQIKKDKYNLYYSCKEGQTGQLGTGFLAKKETVKNIMGFEPINERIYKLRLKGKYHNITIINIHAPTEEKDEETKERFYAELQQTQEKVPKHDPLIILGDYNAKIGRERAYQKVIRNHTLHDITNRNGELVYEYTIANNMVVASTFFQHKNIHKGTWISPDTLILNQINHVLVNNNKKQVIEDVRTLRGPNCDSDHFLVKVIIKQKLITTQKEFVKKLRWNISNLQNPEKLGAYNKRVNDRMDKQEEIQNVEQDWQNIKTAILEAAKETIQTQPRTTYNEWWDEECKEAITEKNIARQKCLQITTRATQEEYEEKRRIATKICRNKKKHWLNNRIKEIEEAHRRNETRKFYKDIKMFKTTEQAGTFLLRGPKVK